MDLWHFPSIWLSLPLNVKQSRDEYLVRGWWVWCRRQPLHQLRWQNFQCRPTVNYGNFHLTFDEQQSHCRVQCHSQPQSVPGDSLELNMQPSSEWSLESELAWECTRHKVLQLYPRFKSGVMHYAVLTGWASHCNLEASMHYDVQVKCMSCNWHWVSRTACCYWPLYRQNRACPFSSDSTYLHPLTQWKSWSKWIHSRGGHGTAM